MEPLGRQGFANAEAAKADANSCLSGVPFAVLKRANSFGESDEYAWCAPLEYAERIKKSNGVEIVERIE